MFGKYRVLKNKNLSLLLFGQLVSNMGTAISGVAIIWHIMGRFEEGNVAFYIALYWLVKLLTEVLSGPISGVVTDRVDRKKIIVYTDLFRGGLELCLAYTLFHKPCLVTPIYIAYFLNFLMGSFFNASVSSVIPNIVEEEAFTSANSIKEILIQFAWIFGSGVSGFLYAQIGIVMILIIDGISFILSGLSESLIDIPRTKVCLDNSMFKDFVEGVKYVKTKKMILVLIGIEFILSFSISPAFRILMPMLVKFQLGLSSKEFGLVEIMLSIGTILGAHYVTSQVDEKHIFRKISKAIVGIGGGFFFMALMSSLNMINRIGQFHVFVSICMGVIVIGILHIAVLIPIKTIYQLNIADDYRGRFYGFYYSAFKISMPLGILTYSFLAKFFSIDKLYLIMSIPLIMIGGVIYSKKIHHHLT